MKGDLFWRYGESSLWKQVKGDGDTLFQADCPFLQSKQVKAIVVACNTASAYALNDLEREIDIPIIGVVKPGAKVAAEVTRNGQVGVIATEGTISSNIYTTYIRQLRPEVQVTGKACPLFVPLVEEGLWQDPVTDEIANVT